MTPLGDGARPDFARMGNILKALGSPARLELLQALKTPKSLAEIRIRPSRKEGDKQPDRLMSNVAVRHHLEQLLEIGAVEHKVQTRDGRDIDHYQVNQRQLFAITEELRRISRIRGDADWVSDGTMPGAPSPKVAKKQGVRLTVLNGPSEGRVHLLGEAMMSGRPCTIGRRKGSDVALDHDPYVSLDNAAIAHKDGVYFLRDDARSRNGTMLNWSPMAKGDECRLKTGDVIQVGRSHLLFHAE